MLTTTEKFDELKAQADLPRTLILKVTGSTTNFYFSDREMEIYDNGVLVRVYGIISSWGSIDRGINVFDPKLKIGSTTIQFSNKPMKNSGAIGVGVSWHLASGYIIGRVATIYAWIEGITDINTDGLIIFTGLVQSPSSIDNDSFKIEIEDRTTKDHKVIPQKIIGVDYIPGSSSTSPFAEEFSEIGEVLPIVYGISGIDDELRGLVHKTRWIEQDKICISDIPLATDDVIDLWIYDSSARRFTRIDESEYSLTYDDSGITTAEFNDILDVAMWLYTFMNGVKTFPATHYCIVDSDEFNESGDRDIDTYTSILSTVADQAQENYAFYLEEGLEAEGDLHTGSTSGYVGVKGKDDGSGSSFFSMAYVYFYNTDDSLGAGQNLINLDSEDEYTEANIGGMIVTGRDYNFNNLNDWAEMRIAVDPKLSGAQSQIFRVWEIRLRLKYSIGISIGRQIYAQLRGRSFGSWIEDASRSAPSGQDTEGDIIENPAYIVESILRDELSLTNDEIDTASFDEAAGAISGWKLSFTITDTTDSLSLIKDICKYSKFFYYINTQGQHSLITLKSSYSADDTLYSYLINSNGFKYRRSAIKEIVNELKLRYSINPENDSVANTITETASTSQSITNYELSKTFNAEKLDDDTTAAALANHICDNTTGFYNQVHYIITVEMLNFEKIHWDCGDIIAIDSSCDSHVYKSASSWNGTLAMIINKKIQNNKLIFEMIDVAVSGGGGA